VTLLAGLLALAAGGLAGFLSGLLGIGGGTILVPFLYLVMAHPEWSGIVVDPSQQTAFAHATSLAIIVPTAASGLLSFRRAGMVEWGAIVPLGLAAAAAALVGAQVAVLVPGDLLRAGFGALVLWIGGRMILGKAKVRAETAPAGSASIRPVPAVLGGGMVGMLSALMGIGGGVIAVPLLVRWARMDLHRVTAASIGIVAFAAPAGILSYAWAGRGVEGLPPGSLGFVSLPLAAALVPGAVLMAPVGARLNRALPVGRLRLLFGIFLSLVGMRLAWGYLAGAGG
jgi:uncharacterized protein